MRIGIYGGTFDPPHLGHREAAEKSIETLGLDKLIVIPAKVPPHKTLEAGSAAAEQRLDMARIMADSLLQPNRVEVNGLELCREGKSYTADTLEALKGQYPEDELWLLMGSDMFFTVQDWYRPERIFSLASLCAFSRTGGEDLAALRRQAERLSKDFGARCVVFALEQGAGVSSTGIRRCLGRGERPQGLSDSVYGYILLHGLYGVDVDLKALTDGQLRACALSMVQAKRHAHILGVEEEAVRLARRWGADPELARRAGILHDCTKYWTLEEHLACCRKYGVALDELELSAVKLLHSKTGACIARYVFAQPEEVCSAIYYHTTGRGDMSLLEKIIYLADYMEPNRKFDGVEEMRRLAYEDLDAAVLMGCEMCIADMEERGYVIHHNTSEARDWLKGKCE